MVYPYDANEYPMDLKTNISQLLSTFKFLNSTTDATGNWSTFASATLPLTFKYPSNMKTKETYELGNGYSAYLSSNEITLPPPSDGTLTALQISYLNQYVNTYDKAKENAKGFFSAETVKTKTLNSDKLSGVLYSGTGVDYWAGRSMSIAVFDRPLAPVIFYFYGDQKDSGFTQAIFEQIIATVSPTP
jgi:hypothetical protein